MTTTPAPDTFVVTLKHYDPATRKQRIYGQRYGAFCVLRTQQGITISPQDDPGIPLFFDKDSILCFSSTEAAQQFITFLMAQRRPTLFERIAGLLRLTPFAHQEVRNHV